MKNQYVLFFLLFILFSCKRVKHFTNSIGWPRPNSQKVFKYKKYANSNKLPSYIDTNAVYVSLGNIKNRLEYFRFFSSGQVFYSYDTMPTFNPNNLDNGYIGYCKAQGDKVKIELFEETYGHYGTLRNTFGFFKNDTLFTFSQTPETYMNSYKLTKKNSSIITWVKDTTYKIIAAKPSW